MKTKYHSRLVWPVAEDLFSTSPDWPTVEGEVFDESGLRELQDSGHGVVVVGEGLSPEHCAILAALEAAGYRFDRARVEWKRAIVLGRPAPK